MLKNFPEGNIINIQGTCISLKGDDIDTDRIIPARFLKCVSFNDLGEQVFADDRIEKNGRHPFDLKDNKGASILIVNDNFGCGSSREHAPQALMRWGIRALIGQSFAEIFYGNCLALGIPCVTTRIDQIINLQEEIDKDPGSIWELNLTKKIFKGKIKSYSVDIEKGPQQMLYSGQWDATSQLIRQEKKLTERINKLPYLNKFK